MIANLVIGSMFLVLLALMLAEHSRHAAYRRILEALSDNAWALGVELCERAHVGRGIIYAHLDHLEEHGFVESRVAPATPPGFLPRRLYRITSAGHRLLAEEGDSQC